jgi:hypothetical protein
MKLEVLKGMRKIVNNLGCKKTRKILRKLLKLSTLL